MLFYVNSWGYENIESGSRSNQAEAKLVLGLVEQLLPEFLCREITVITGYKAQRDLVHNMLVEKKYPVEVSTIDSSEGRENKVIIVSLTCTQGVGFFEDKRRVCVCLSRAQEPLFLVGKRRFWEAQTVSSPLQELSKLAVDYQVK